MSNTNGVENHLKVLIVLLLFKFVLILIISFVQEMLKINLDFLKKDKSIKKIKKNDIIYWKGQVLLLRYHEII